MHWSLAGHPRQVYGGAGIWAIWWTCQGLAPQGTGSQSSTAPPGSCKRGKTSVSLLASYGAAGTDMGKSMYAWQTADDFDREEGSPSER